MIIGKSLTAIVSGGLEPEIHVTALAGALLNLRLKNSSIILQSYQLGASETQHTFIVNMSDTAYIIEDATNGISVEVLVNTVSLFNAQIQYAYITVTAKASALLNLHLKNSSIILQTYQLSASETTHTFIVDTNSVAYVIDDVTNGKSVEVLVSSASTFSVAIDYYFYLYNLGDQCTSVTGGWKFYENRVDAQGDTEPHTVGMMTNNKINFSGFTKIYIEYYYSTTSAYKPADVGLLGYSPIRRVYDYDDDEHDGDARKLSAIGSRTLESFSLPSAVSTTNKRVYFGVAEHWTSTDDRWGSSENSDNLYAYYTTAKGGYAGTRAINVYKIYLE